MPVRLNINGSDYQSRIEPRTTLLDALRDTVGLTDTKKECDRGEYGARTVHIEGRRVLSYDARGHAAWQTHQDD